LIVIEDLTSQIELHSQVEIWEVMAKGNDGRYQNRKKPYNNRTDWAPSKMVFVPGEISLEQYAFRN
jgi:hypothetical protein